MIDKLDTFSFYLGHGNAGKQNNGNSTNDDEHIVKYSRNNYDYIDESQLNKPGVYERIDDIQKD